MTRRLYRSMAQGRAMLNRTGRATSGTLSAEDMAAVQRKLAASDAAFDEWLEAEVRRREPKPWVAHPVVERTETPYYVARLFRVQGHSCRETIGNFLTVEAATEFMKTEQWRAQVFTGLDMVCADNWRAMEKR